jgi:16S rRNA (adenine1518-N6/adenine1519-N6)-dimethyltransferase
MIKDNLSQFANKRYGQNFLKSDVVVRQIIQSMPNDTLRVVEIGPGLGDLTKELVRVRSVTAFEVDKRLCEHLHREFSDPISTGDLTLSCGDVLERWEERSLVDEKYHLVANLPYYIATNIILKAFKDPNCKSVLVMVQKEVAVKFSAKVSQKEFSALSVLTQTIGEAYICFDVPKEAFVPPPNVTSSVLFIRKENTEDDENFEDFLKIAFKQPRKKLSKNLSVTFAKDTIEKLFDNLGLKPNLRPHEAETTIYHHLYNELKKDLIDGKEQSREQRTTETTKSKS